MFSRVKSSSRKYNLGRENSSHQHGHVADLFTTISLTVNEPVDAERLAEQLATETTGLVRAKGFVTDADGTQKTIQTVGRRWTVTDAPEGVENGLIAIGPKDKVSAERLEDFIAKTSP